MPSTDIRVASPWSLSHYILLNGFHPLYRALVDHAPAGVKINAWDNVRLHKRLSLDVGIREAVLNAANEAKRNSSRLGSGRVASAYQKYFWPPNQALTSELAGDIEFHHTAPFPSLERPFVFHCESFAPVFVPLTRQGSGDFENHAEIRDYYRRIFANPLCLGIFSHIPETLQSLRRFFSDSDIDNKLFSSRIGLSLNAILDPQLPEKPVLSRPRFLFVNSAHQNPANFFHRGGHIALRFWKEFRSGGRDGLLMLRCARPRAESLAEHGVDASFLSAETGRSIIWAEDYLANHEMNALTAGAHFFLLPSSSLHSVSIMQAMTLGTIPVVTDTVGTSVYVTDGEHGIVLQGVRAANWHTDPNTGILVDRYCRTPGLDDSLVGQMTLRIIALLDAPEAYEAMRKRGMAVAREQFSGEAFSNQFWSAVSDLYQRHMRSSSGSGRASSPLANALHDCALQDEDWARVFESVTQPMQRIHTGKSVVTELGGAIIHTCGTQEMKLNDWSVVAQYWVFDAPRMTFANSIDELEGAYLSYSGEGGQGAIRKLTRFIGKVLMPYPEIHGFAAGVLRRLRRYHRFIAFRFGKLAVTAPQPAQAVPDNVVSDRPRLALEGFHGFNIIKQGKEFHAILQGEGAFELAKIRSNEYSRSFSGRSLAEVQDAIVASFDSKTGSTGSQSQPGSGAMGH